MPTVDIRLKTTLVGPNQLHHKQILAHYLWIDAMCIFQPDDSGKNHQVRQMGEVYKGADHVVIWWGKIQEGFDELIRDLHDLYAAKTAFLTPKDRKAYRDRLSAFYDLPYWSRLWVVQEVLLVRGAPHRKLAIFPGSHLIDFDSLFRSIMRVTNDIGESAIKKLTNSQYHKYGQYSLYRNTPDDRFIVPAPRAHLLVTFKLECRDRYGRIFALLSISDDASSICVNYGLDKEQVFQHVLQQPVTESSLNESLALGAILIQSLELRDLGYHHYWWDSPPARQFCALSLGLKASAVGVGKPT